MSSWMARGLLMLTFTDSCPLLTIRLVACPSENTAICPFVHAGAEEFWEVGDKPFFGGGPKLRWFSISKYNLDKYTFCCGELSKISNAFITDWKLGKCYRIGFLAIFDLFYLGEDQRYKAFLINFILYYLNLILLDEEHYNSILHLHAIRMENIRILFM